LQDQNRIGGLIAWTLGEAVIGGGGGGWDLSWAFVVSLEWRNRGG